MVPARGFLLHDPLVNTSNLEAVDGSDTGSDYSQMGPRPGSPEPGDPLGTYLPHVHHAQAADLDIIALRAGAPSRNLGAGLGYRPSGESYRGWNEPNILWGYAPVDWSTTVDYSTAAAVTCPGTQRIVLAAASGTAPVTVWVWNPASRTWSSGAQPSSTTYNLCALVVLRRTGRVLLLLASSSTGAGAVYYSDDDGTTWADYAPFALPAGTLDSTVDELAMAEDGNGALCLVAKASLSGTWWQFASSSSGVQWSQVDTGGGIPLSPSLCRVSTGQLLLTYVTVVGTSAARRLLSDAYDPISGADEETILGGTNPSYVRTVVDDDGMVYAVVSKHQSDVVHLWRDSTDGDDGWQSYSEGLISKGGSISDPTDHRYHAMAAAMSGGELVSVFASTHATSPSTDGSLISVWSGGWSNVEAGESTGFRASRRAWGNTGDSDGSGVWLPTELLANQGWTHTNTAATLLNGYHRYNMVAANGYDTLTAGGHAAGPFSLLLELRCAAGGSLTDNSATFLHQRRNGSVAYKLRLRCSTDGIRVVDDSGGGADLATIDAPMGESWVQVLIVYTSDSEVVVMWKRRADTMWGRAVSATLGSDATAATTDLYQVGCVDVTTTDFQVGAICFMNRSLLHGVASTWLSNFLRWGKAATASPYPIRDQVDPDFQVARLSGGGGVARYRETWEIPAEWDHGVAELDPVRSPKPTATWRGGNADEDGPPTFTWDLGADSRLGSSGSIGLCLVRPNFGRAVLEVATSLDPPTFHEIGEWNSRAIASTFEREGNLLKPAAGAVQGALYFGADWMRGGYVVLDPDGTPVARRIRGNEGGTWGDGGQAVIELEGVDGTEPTSGTVHVYLPGGVLVLHAPLPERYRWVRLRVLDQPRPEAYYELGGVVLGSLWVPGEQWSRGWSVRYVPRTRVEEDDEGTTYVDLQEGDDGRPLRREITVAWQDGAALAALRAQVARARRAGRSRLAARGDVWFQVAGLLGRSQGARVPSVALLEVPPQGGMVLDPTLHSFGRLGAGQAWQVNHVQGHEGHSEIVRGESLTHVEL